MDEGSVDDALAARIAEAQELAASPFMPGVDSPAVDGTRISVVTENGEIIDVTVSVTLADNGLVITGDGFSMQLTVVDKDGNLIPVDDAKRLVLREGAVLTLKGTGFAPNSTVTLWLFSQPVDLGEVTANAQGEVEVSVSLPAGVELGEHTVQMAGVSAEGELRVLNVAIVVEEAPSAGALPILPVAAGLLVLALVGAFLVTRRSRSGEQPGVES